jgi:hypothetical protein
MFNFSYVSYLTIFFHFPSTRKKRKKNKDRCDWLICGFLDSQPERPSQNFTLNKSFLPPFLVLLPCYPATFLYFPFIIPLFGSFSYSPILSCLSAYLKIRISVHCCLFLLTILTIQNPFFHPHSHSVIHTCSLFPFYLLFLSFIQDLINRVRVAFPIFHYFMRTLP